MTPLVRQQILKQVAAERGCDPLHLLPHPFFPASLLLDLLLGQLLICPLVTCCWSAWYLGDHLVDSLLVPGDPLAGMLLSLVLGTAVTSCLRCVAFCPALPVNTPSLLYLLLTRGFTLLYFCTYLLIWRGWWSLLSLLQLPLPLLLLLGLLLLLLAGCLATNIGAPLVLSRDSRASYLCVPLYPFPSSMVVSILITAVLEVASIACWFSTWILARDLVSLVTSSPLPSSLLSLALGGAATLAAFMLQFPLLACTRSWSDVEASSLAPLCQAGSLLASSLISVLGLISTVVSLSGYWQLLDLLFPTRQLLTALLLPGVIGATGLSLMGVASCLHGGVCPSPRPGSLLAGWLVTSWLLKEGRQEGQQEEEAFIRF